MTKVLTDTQIRSLKHPPAGQIDIKDIRSPGLFLRVTSETKTWSLRFSCPLTGKRQRMTLAKFPDLSLADARERARELRTLVAKGVNPIEAKRHERTEAPKKTFAALADRYLAEHASRFKKSADADRRNLRLHVLPQWGKRNYAGITRADIIELVEGLIAAGTPVLANRVHSLISKILSFAVDSSLLAANPAGGLKKRAPETPHDRVLSDDEIRWFWSAVLSGPKSTSAGLALKLALLTGLRAGEVAGLRRSELVDIDNPEKAALLIDGRRVKNGRSHLVPLAPTARQLVLEAIDTAGNSEFVFPSRTGKAASLNAYALAWVMSRLAKSVTLESWKADPPSAHDLRRTVATRMAALKISREDRLSCLNHAVGDVHAKHYDCYDRQDEKRRAFCTWANALARILDGDDGASVVVPMRRPS